MWCLAGIIGEVESGEDRKNEYYLWTHKKLDIGYNGDKVGFVSKLHANVPLTMVLCMCVCVFTLCIFNAGAITTTYTTSMPVLLV